MSVGDVSKGVLSMGVTTQYMSIYVWCEWGMLLYSVWGRAVCV